MLPDGESQFFLICCLVFTGMSLTWWEPPPPPAPQPNQFSLSYACLWKLLICFSGNCKNQPEVGIHHRKLQQRWLNFSLTL